MLLTLYFCALCCDIYCPSVPRSQSADIHDTWHVYSMVYGSGDTKVLGSRILNFSACAAGHRPQLTPADPAARCHDFQNPTAPAPLGHVDDTWAWHVYSMGLESGDNFYEAEIQNSAHAPRGTAHKFCPCGLKFFKTLPLLHAWADVNDTWHTRVWANIVDRSDLLYLVWGHEAEFSVSAHAPRGTTHNSTQPLSPTQTLYIHSTLQLQRGVKRADTLRRILRAKKKSQRKT